MAATTDSAVTRTSVDRIIHEVTFSSINDGETFNYSYPSNLPACNPTYVRWVTTTCGSGGDMLSVAWTANNTPGAANSSRVVQLKISTWPGGDTTDAVVRVYLEWHESAYGGIS